jgi:hypothetical protein
VHLLDQSVPASSLEIAPHGGGHWAGPASIPFQDCDVAKLDALTCRTLEHLEMKRSELDFNDCYRNAGFCGVRWFEGQFEFLPSPGKRSWAYSESFLISKVQWEITKNGENITVASSGVWIPDQRHQM